MAKVKASGLLRFQKRMCKLFVNKSELMFGLGLLVMFCLTVIVGPHMQISENSDYDWTVTSSDESKYQDMTTDILSNVDPIASTTQKSAVLERSSILGKFYFMFVYTSKASSLFTPEAVQNMCQIESLLWDMDEYQTSFCQLEPNPQRRMPNSTCAIPSLSLVPVFYQWTTTNTRACTLLSVDSVSKTEKMLLQSLANPKQGTAFFMGSSVLKTKPPSKTTITRSYLGLGGPLKGYKNIDDRSSEQKAKYQKMAEVLEKKLFEHFKLTNTFTKSAYRSKATAGPLNVYFFGLLFQDLEFGRVVNGDLSWTLASITFVYIYMAIHTGSFFLASVGMLQILLSIPISFCIFRFVFQVQFFTQLHILTIFLVLGVGADDIFVLSDTWKQSAKIKSKSSNMLFDRMLHTYNHAFFAIFNTSFTTAMAFMSTAFSPVMPISSFGIFAAIAIVVNYLYVIVFTPSALVFHHKYLSHRGFCGLVSKETRKDCFKVSDDYINDVTIESIQVELESCKSDCSTDGMVVRFFSGPYSKFICNRICGVGAVIIFLGVLIQGIYNASKLSTPETQEEFFPEDHMWTGFNDMLSNSFLAGPDDSYIKGSIVWGVKDLDRSKYIPWTPTLNRGSVIYDNTVDFSTQNALDHVISTCQKFRDYKCELDGCMDSSKRLIRLNSVECWPETMKAYYNGTIPIGKSFLPALLTFRKKNPQFSTSIGFVEKNLKFIRVKLTFTLMKRQPYSKTQPIIAVANDILESQQKSSPKSLGTPYIDGGRSFVWAQTEKGLVDGMFNGLLMCFPIAFLVLLGATKNYITSFYAIVSIAAIVGCVLGFCHSALGWSLGTAESVSAVIVIGFSVDYVVHLGHVFQESKAATREGKIAETAHHMAPTVFAGAITTLGAGIFMSACQMVFFTKMAALITLTISFSLMFSLIFFMGLLAQFSPRSSLGTISFPNQKAKNAAVAGY